MKSILTLAAILATGSLIAQTTLPVPVASKMKVPGLSSNAGSTVAMNETYILSGSPTSTNGAFTFAGDVMVFRVTDGSFVRRIVSPFPATNGAFGRGLAVYGGIAYIGAEGEEPSPSVVDSGAVYAFDIATGKLLWFSLGNAGQELGYSLAVSGDLIAAGGPRGQLSGQPSDSGSVAILDRKDGFLINSYRMASPAASDWFGYSLAMQGRLLAVGAPKRDSGGMADAGEVAIFDAIAGGAMTIISAGNKQVSAEFGSAVALTKDVLAVGSPWWDNGGSTGAGFVYLYNSDGSSRPNHFLSIATSHKQFGRSLAAAGNMILVGGVNTANGGEAFLFDINDEVDEGVEVALHTSADAVNLGCAVAMTEQAFVIGDGLQPITGSSNKGALWLARMPHQKLSPSYRYGMTNDTAPGANGARYASFADPTLLENNGGIMFRAGLKGTGVTTANNSAVFNDWSVSPPELILRKGTKVGTQTVTALSSMFFVPTSNAWPIIRTTTGGVATVFRDDGTNLIADLRVGAVPTNPGVGATIGTLRALAGGGVSDASASLIYTAKLGSGVTTANDSRMAVWKQAFLQHVDLVAEGDQYDMSTTVGQISPRIAAGAERIVIHCALSGSTATNTAVINSQSGSMGGVARKGATATGTTGTFATFLGEGVNTKQTCLIRATTSNGLEGLWMNDTFPIRKIAVKGDPAPGAPTGVKFSRFNRFFIDDANSVLFTATLTGPGVTTANDQGVWLHRSGILSLLLREGDPAPDCGSARIATLSAVDFCTLTGRYTILATLTGSTATNQALFFGDSTKATTIGRQPMLNLRKGSYIDKPGGKRITSLSIGTHNIDTAGSGSKGTVRLVSDEGALVKVTYSDTLQELMTLRP